MKRWLRKSVIMMISVTLLMLNPGAISIQSGNEADCGSTTDTRTESSRATWDSTIVIDKNYIVQSGENLLIESGAKIFVEDDMGIFVEGTLTVSGTAAAPVIFSGAGSAAKWNGIQFNDTANTLGSSISYTKISDAKTAVAYQSGSVSISDVELSNNDVAVSMYLSSGSIRDTTFDSNKIGISADSSNLQISNSTIKSSSTNDIAVQNNALLKLINVIFDENKLNIDDIFSSLEISWYLKITVNDDNYPSIYGTHITVMDFFGNEIYSLTLDSALVTHYLECKAFTLTANAAEPNKISRRYFTSHMVTVDRFGAQQTQLVYLDSSKHLVFHWDFGTGIAASASEVSAGCQEAFMHDFVNLGWKHTTRQEKVNASNYLASRMRRLGNYQVEFDNHTHLDYPVDDGRNVDLQLANIVCTLPGKNNDADTYIALTAHYDTDHHKDVSGADDDGSGVTALLEIARIIGRTEFNVTIKIIFFDGEEEDYIGSYDYVKAASESGHDIITDINLDMIGYNQNLSYPCIIRTNSNSLSIAQEVKNLNDVYSFGLDATVINDAAYRRSDYFRFWDFGYPAIDFVEADTVEMWNVYYHTAEDSYDKINFSYLKKMTQLAIAGLIYYADPANIAPTEPADIVPESTHLQMPELSWRPAVDINGDDISYKLVVKDGTENIVDESISENRYTFSNNLTYGKIYSIALEAFDDEGASSKTLTSALEVINTPPVLSHIPDQVLTQDITWGLQVVAVDTDIPEDTISFSVNPAIFDIDRYSGYVNWTPSKYYVGEFFVNFSVSDGKGGMDFQLVRINIENVNDPPEINYTPEAISFDEDTKLANAFNLNKIFVDVDNDELTFTFYNNGNVKLDIMPNGSVDLGAVENWFGRESILIKATDPSGANVTHPQEVNVNPINDAPKLKFIPDVFINESEKLEVMPDAVDIENDALSFSLTGIGQNGVWQTDFFSAGTYRMNITVTDGELSDWQLINIYVNNKNRDPEQKQAPPESLTLEVDEDFTFSALFFDPDDDHNNNGELDAPEKDNLSYTWDLGDETLKTGKTIKHSYAKSGRYLVVLSVTDPDNGSVVLKINVTVKSASGLSSSMLVGLSVSLIVIVIIISFLVFRKKIFMKSYDSKESDDKTEDMPQENKKEKKDEQDQKKDQKSENDNLE